MEDVSSPPTYTTTSAARAAAIAAAMPLESVELTAHPVAVVVLPPWFIAAMAS